MRPWISDSSRGNFSDNVISLLDYFWNNPIGKPEPRKCDVSFSVTMLRSPLLAAAIL
jgi:hypothetical protein